MIHRGSPQKHRQQLPLQFIKPRNRATLNQTGRLSKYKGAGGLILVTIEARTTEKYPPCEISFLI